MKSKQPTETIAYEQATSYRRLAARLLDLVAAFIFVVTPLGMLLWGGITSLLGAQATNSAAIGWGAILTFFLLFMAYDALFIRLWGKTPGMAALGMRVTDIEGQRLTWGRAIARSVALYLLGIGFAAATALTASIFGWWLLFGLGKYQRFPHDKAARCFVVREVKGQLKEAGPTPEIKGPLAEMERLRAEGIISEDEYQRKMNELSR
jgi:uncharacterized RDD family membrane protein YckC